MTGSQAGEPMCLGGGTPVPKHHCPGAQGQLVRVPTVLTVLRLSLSSLVPARPFTNQQTELTRWPIRSPAHQQGHLEKSPGAAQ